MVISWLITTIVTSVLMILFEYVNYLSVPVDTTVIYIAPSFIELILTVIGINLFFWLPSIIYLHKNKKVSLISSTISSVVATIIGGVCIIGIGILVFYAKVEFQQIDELKGYTDWTIGHIHYWPGIVSNIVLWGINGILFWKLYNFVTNKPLQRTSR
jgi:hypothetical protein